MPAVPTLQRSGRQITITPVANGFVVTAGCLTLVFTDKGKLANELARWLGNPTKMEEEYAKEYIVGGDSEVPRAHGTGIDSLGGIAGGYRAMYDDR